MVTTDEDVSFSWGKKKGRGGAKKEVQFYESFTYDGVEYFLYDSVYLYKEDELEPYIGKLIKIWEAVNKSRKVKILWFFHPSEISNYLKHEKVLESELFLASGDGMGLTNINPVEAIAGKCNVVCISKDERNRQPSVEELDMADYVFYRTFDVGSLTILDKLGGKISSIEVGFLLNKSDVQLLKENHDIKIDNPNDMAVVEKPVLLDEDVVGEGNAMELDANIGSTSAKGEEESNLMDKSRSPPGTHDISASELHSVSGQKTKLISPDSKKADLSKVVNSAPNVGPSENQFCNKSELRGCVNEKKVNYGVKSVVDSGENIEDPVSSSVAADKGKSGVQKEFAGPGEAVRNEKAVGNHIALAEGLSKKRKLDDASHSSDNGKKLKPDGRGPGTDNARNDTPQSAAVSADRSKALRQAASVPAETSGKGKLAKEFDGISNGHSEMLKSHGGEQNKSNDKLCKASLKSGKGLEVKELVGTSNALSKKLKSDGMEVKSNGKLNNGLPKRLKSDGVLKDRSVDKLPKASLKQSKNLEIEAYGCVKEVIRRPSTDKERYYTSIEVRMKIAQDQGTLVLLQNLDPTYTSSEVEDIVLCAFGEICSAKMVQCTAASSRHSGQAFVIFKTREAAERVIMKLNQECLILPNLRPLVGNLGTLSSPETQPSFPGHLTIDKFKHQCLQTQRESKEAVSTSHSSQPNTLEYELALEWRLLQDRSDLCWRKLYKQQAEELKRLKKSFKSKK